MPDAIVPSPQVGQSPPIAICFCQTGPAARLFRLNVYTMPFLFATESSWCPAASVVSVGVVPQSESRTDASNGICQELRYCSVVALSATIACDWVCVWSFSVPVETKIVFVAWSYAGVVHTPPPTCPFGTKLYVLTTMPCCAPEMATCSNCPCTSGLSQLLATPM